LGIVAVFSLPISQYPNIVPPTVMVTARYPGASPQTIVDTVALPIELQVNGVDGMLYMQSTAAADGTYQLIVTFKIASIQIRRKFVCKTAFRMRLHNFQRLCSRKASQ